jgi:hypothetical protein
MGQLARTCEGSGWACGRLTSAFIHEGFLHGIQQAQNDRRQAAAREAAIRRATELSSRARCPACRTIGDVDLRTLDWHRGAAVTALTPALSCRSCRPNAPFAELVCLSKSSLAEDFARHYSGNKWVNE